MRLLGFSLYDTKTGTYSVPFFMNHQASAIRAVIDLASDLNTTVGRHPADYSLCQVGAFDDATGVFEAVQPVPLGSVVGFLPAPSPAPLFANKE